MKFKIKINYTTGNTFGSEDVDRILDHCWENAEVAAKNLERIKRHNDWFKYEAGYYEEVPKPDFTCEKYSLNLLNDDGSEFSISAFWCGYFEHLNYSSVELDLPEIKY